MKKIRDAVLNAVYKCEADDDRLIDSLDEIIQNNGQTACAVFFDVMTHIDLEPEAAAYCWKMILDHRRQLNAMLGRKVNLRTVICDYFCSVDKTLKNPIFVEIHVFENQLKTFVRDSLTGLYNRAAFDAALIKEMARARRHETELSVIFLDLDDFKLVNDRFGHLAGDAVLKDVGGIINNMIRSEDTAARYGGEEIVILLPETGKKNALILAERIRSKIEALNIEYEDKRIHPTVSGGLASYPIDAQSGPELIKHADFALYRAKEFGKNNITVYSQNRRRFFRCDLFSNIQIRPVNFGTEPETVVAVGKNISVSGLLFESRYGFEIGARLELQIPVGTGRTPFVVMGTVVRVELFSAELYDIGVAFLEIDKTTRNEISRYMIRQVDCEKN
jgi:diguanylate cyclase (GGDEF)-like protein